MVADLVQQATATGRRNVPHRFLLHGDAANAVFAVAGYNFRRLLEWLALLLSIVLATLNAATSQGRPLKPA
jgi:hypothetical protein